MLATSAGGNLGRPHVLHVIDQLEQRGGAEASLLALLPRLANSDQTHAVLALRGTVPDREGLCRAGVGVLPARGADSRASRVRAVRSAIQLFRPDLIHSTLFEADLAARIAGAAAQVPVLVSLVNAGYGREARDAERVAAWKMSAVRVVDRVLAARGTAHFHAISRSVRDHAIEHLAINPAVMTVIPRGRDPIAMGTVSAARRTEVRRRLGWSEDQSVILNVAREEPQKDQVGLIAAFDRVAATRPGALLVIAGRRGRSSTTVDDAIRSSRFRGQIVRLGVRDDVPDLLAAADVFVLSSRYEGLGGVVVEAAAMQLPVVVTAVPAILEVVGADYPWVAPIEDVPALAATISNSLGAGAAARHELGLRLRKRFEERFDLQSAAKAHVALYQHLYNETKGHRSLRDLFAGRQIESETSAALRRAGCGLPSK